MRSGSRPTLRWGWGWIGWADLHFFANDRPKDYSRAEELLHRGYSTPDARDREEIADRLALLYRETGRDEEAHALAAEAKRISRSRTLRASDGRSSWRTPATAPSSATRQLPPLKVRVSRSTG